MDDGIGVSAIDNTGSPPRVSPQGAQGVQSIQDAAGEREKQKRPEPTEAAAKIEILTKTDIEIRKLHALRRAKEYFEQKLTDAAENVLAGVSVDAPKNESPVAIAYNRITKTPAAELSASPLGAETDASFKTESAISGYRSFKKETPKAWSEGAMDEKR